MTEEITHPECAGGCENTGFIQLVQVCILGQKGKGCLPGTRECRDIGILRPATGRAKDLLTPGVMRVCL